MNLQTAVNMLPTPLARDWKSGKGRTQEQRGRRTSNQTLAESQGGQLNPDWVEWLMGWPIGWTSLGPLNPEAFREWQMEFRIESDASNASETGKCRRAL
jgi:hypothetical protein